MSKTGLKIEASNNGKKGSLRIVEEIGVNSYTGSSSTVRYYVDSFIEKGFTDVDVYINSRGGSVFEASEIANELKRVPNVTLTIGSVAASAATYLMAKFKCRAYSNSQFMIHRPRMTASGDSQAIENDLKLLNNLTSDYRSAYAQKMQISEEEVENLFNKGDYWMTAQEAKEKKLLDEIIEEEEQEITSLDVAILTACGAPNIPAVNSNADKHKTDNTMNRNAMLATLGLPADATDEQMEAKAKEIAEKATTADAAKNEATALKEATAKAMVQTAIDEKRIPADAKAHYEKLAAADYDATKQILASMSVPVKGSDFIDPKASNQGNQDARASWKFEDFAEKDPDALKAMMVKEPEKFEALSKDYFGS